MSIVSGLTWLGYKFPWQPKGRLYICLRYQTSTLTLNVLDRLLIVFGRHLLLSWNVNRPSLGQKPDSITDVNKMLGVEVGLETLLAVPGPLHSNQVHRGDCMVKQARLQASPGNETFRAILLSQWP